MATVKVKFRPSTVADRPGSIVINVNPSPCSEANHDRLQSVSL